MKLNQSNWKSAALPMFSVAFLYPLNSVANWQYTNWGMSFDQVASLVDKGLTKTTDRQKQDREIPGFGTAFFRSVYKASDFEFEATFYLKAGKLFAVSLKPANATEGHQLHSLLKRRYGSPLKNEDKLLNNGNCRNIITEWHDLEEKNQVTFQMNQCINIAPYNGLTSTSIIYQPLIGKESGL